MQKRQLRWIVLLVWTLYAFVFTTLQYYAARQFNRTFDWWHYFAWNLFGSYLWAALTPLIVLFARRFAFESANFARNLLLHLLFSVCFLITQNALFVLPRWLLDPSVLAHHASLKSLYQGQFMYSLPLDIMTYLVVLVSIQTVDYYRRYKEGELSRAELRTQLARAQVQALKMQLNPHFLFNTLNVISELIHTNPDAADEMITQLSDMLRTSLEKIGVQEVRLKQELDFLEKYLAIEQTRMGNRLRIEIEIASDTLDARVPNMLLQPLVENAVRHGIAPQADGGTIRIEARRHGADLCLHISDTGRGLTKEKERALKLESAEPLENVMQKGNAGDDSSVNTNGLSVHSKIYNGHTKSGVGLNNTRTRLAHLYGATHRFELRSVEPHGLTVCIQIPFREDADDENFTNPNIDS